MALDGIKLIACDMDGTLLLNDARYPSPTIYEQVEQLAERGVPFFAASGRTHHSLAELFAPVADRIGYVCENGAMAVMGGRVLTSRTMPRELAMRLIEMVVEYPGAKVSVSGSRCIFLESKYPDFAEWQRREVHNLVKVFDKPQDIDDEILKIAFFIPPAQQAACLAHFQRQIADIEGLTIVTSGADWLDFIPVGVDKGAALAEAGRVLGIDPADMAAFGDNENDREMMELVGHPFLMDPCNPSMLDIARTRPALRRCVRVEDTLAELLA